MTIKYVPMDSPLHLWNCDFEFEGQPFSVQFTFDIHTESYELISVTENFIQPFDVLEYSDYMPAINAAINDMIPEITAKINHYWEEDKWHSIYDTKQFNERYD